MPAEAERREELVPAGEELVVPSREAECAKGERLRGRSSLGQLRRLELDAIPHAERATPANFSTVPPVSSISSRIAP
jgi:hypothetical protein